MPLWTLPDGSTAHVSLVDTEQEASWDNPGDRTEGQEASPPVIPDSSPHERICICSECQPYWPRATTEVARTALADVERLTVERDELKRQLAEREACEHCMVKAGIAAMEAELAEPKASALDQGAPTPEPVEPMPGQY